MGRNAASQIFWSMSVDTDPKIQTTWYCQQHGKWDQVQNIDPLISILTLKPHLESDHGNVEQ